MLGQAIRLEYERSLQRRLARDSRGCVYLMTLDSDARGRPSLVLRRSPKTDPRSLDDFSDPVPIGAPRRAGDDLFAAGMVIDHHDRMHVAENTAAGAAWYWTANLGAGNRPGAIRRGNVVPIGNNTRLGDLAVAADGAVWLTWIVPGKRDHVASLHMGSRSDGRWRPRKLVEAYGISPPSLLTCSDGSFHLAWHDIGEDLYCLTGMLADVGKRKPWKPRKVLDRARRPAMAELNGRRTAVYENDGAALDYVALDGSAADRSFVTWPDERFIGHTCHSPKFSVDRHGVPWLFFIDSTRQRIFCTRWLGAGWGPIQSGPAMIRNSPRFEDNHLSLDRFDVESPQAEGATGMVLALTHDGPPSSTRVSLVEVPTLKADAGAKVLFLDLKEIQGMNGLCLRLNAAKKSPANPLLQRSRRGPDASGVCVPSVLKEQGVYRLWYHGVHVSDRIPWWEWFTPGYAESTDGLRFVRRNGKLTRSRPAGSRPAHPPLPCGCHVFHDPAEPNPNRRYKMLEFANAGTQLEEVRQGLTDPWSDMVQGWLHCSPDGFRWSRSKARLRFPSGRPFSFVPQFLFRDVAERDPDRRFKAYGFTSLNMGRRGGAYAYSPDALQWTYWQDNPVLDPFARCVPVVRGGKIHQVHDTVVWPHAGYYLALYQYQHHSGILDVELAVSRDGETFVAVCPGAKVLSLDSPKSWDSAEITPAVPVVDGERMLLYYGAAGRHVSNVDKTGSDLNEDEIPRGIGLAVLRPDGFTHVEPDADRGGGTLTTILVRSGAAQTLRVNADCRKGSSIRVELLHAQEEKPLAGYARADARPIRGDQPDATVRWKGPDTLPEGEETFRIRFQLEGQHARLYSFGFL